MTTAPYDPAFYEDTTASALESARIIVPSLLTLVRPASVIDVGCGLGAWLRVFQDHGAEAVYGLDGPWVDVSQLLIPPSSFRRTDLRAPLDVPGQYDLAICLEVAEHLPYLAGRRLVRTLTSTAPLVLFSAAIPGQGGTDHINEQWPSYWRKEFRRHGFIRLDPIRPRVWYDRRVSLWYRQNVFLYASPDAIALSPALQAEQERVIGTPLELVSEDVLRRYAGLRSLLAEIPHMSMRAIRQRVQRLLERDDVAIPASADH